LTVVVKTYILERGRTRIERLLFIASEEVGVRNWTSAARSAAKSAWSGRSDLRQRGSSRWSSSASSRLQCRGRSCVHGCNGCWLTNVLLRSGNGVILRVVSGHGIRDKHAFVFLHRRILLKVYTSGAVSLCRFGWLVFRYVKARTRVSLLAAKWIREHVLITGSSTGASCWPCSTSEVHGTPAILIFHLF